jgi:hypothetical protein
VQLINVFNGIHQASCKSELDGAITITSCNTLHIGYKYCGAMALSAAWPFDVPLIWGNTVVGALVLLPIHSNADVHHVGNAQLFENTHTHTHMCLEHCESQL